MSGRSNISSRFDTVRPEVILPPIPDEFEAALKYPPFPMQVSRIVEDQFIFDRPDGMDRAIADGFFLVAIPNDFEVHAGDEFARHFFEDPRGDALDVCRGFRKIEIPGQFQGYFDRQYDQWENFYIERANWAPTLPPLVKILGHQMANLGVRILRNALNRVGIPERHWLQVTGGLLVGKGHQMLGFNHFRSDKCRRGTKFHRDSGWVTILRTVEPGLLGLVEGKLYSINPLPGHFIVNFGSTIELLTRSLRRPVRANIHGVARTVRKGGEPNRTSYVIFLDSDLNGSVYRYDGRRPWVVQSMADFATQEVNRTYDHDDLHL